MNTDRVNSFLKYQFPAIFWALCIFVESSVPGRKLPVFPHGFDKLVHATIFFILCWFVHRAFRFQTNTLILHTSLFLAVAVSIFYGVTDEFHQIYVPGRTPDPYDLLADSMGAALYVMIVTIAYVREAIARKKGSLSRSHADDGSRKRK